MVFAFGSRVMAISRIAKRIILGHDPAYGSAREQLAHELLDWHGGMASGLYSVSSAWLGDNEADPTDIGLAIDELQALLDDEVPQAGEIAHVRELKARLEAERD